MNMADTAYKKLFDVAKECDLMKAHMFKWFAEHGFTKAVVGVSGGADSTVTCKVACDVLGPKNVYAVKMPNGVQADIADSNNVVEFCDCNESTINISDAFKGLNEQFIKSGFELNSVYSTNTPARLRMATLYGVSAIVGGVVLNTCNLSEDCAWGNFSTLYGDNAGSYACLQGFTKTEVRMLGEYLGIPSKLVWKTPSDGMCGKSDEARIAELSGVSKFTYAEFDKFIRGLETSFSRSDMQRLVWGYKKGAFKNELVNIPHYTPKLPNVFIDNKW